MSGQRRTQLFDREGLATRRQLLGWGVASKAIESDLRVGRYHVVHRGVYAIGPLSPRGEMVAAMLAGGPGAGLCFACALVPFGLMTPRATLDVAVETDRRDSDRVRFHRLSLAAMDLTWRDGLRVTTIERTLLDLASIGVNISPLAHQAVAKHLTTREKLADTAARHRGRKGAKALRRVAGEPHLRGKLERPFLAFLDDNGLPRPLVNHPIGPFTVDFLYPDLNLVIETDEDAHRSAWAFEDDRKRDRYLAAHGYRVMRITEASMRDERLPHDLRAALTYA
jgi:Protein of unknown function (DUF559)